MKIKLVPVIIFLALFIIPFFWLKPGELDLGGDSSRLYFYDPINYFKGQSLFSISFSGFGEENSSYYGIPFFLFLTVLKNISSSSTVLISAFNGISLSFAFLFIYLIVYTLLYRDPHKFSSQFSSYAAIVAGLFYVFSPVPILNWGHNIITYNQVFLNPLMFYLLLQFFLSGQRLYFFLFLLISLIFSPNFSFVGAPPFFAFYPISLLFLVFYIKYIFGKNIQISTIVKCTCIFILIHSFQLLPVAINIFSPGNLVADTLFSAGVNENRGIGYFSAIAPSIRASLNLLALPQLTPLKFYSSIFIVFPLLVLLALWWNKRKSMLLTAIFFLIAFFWETAVITNIGFSIYKSLFSIPGFAMFRNYFAQWQYLFLFFYALLVGQSVATILEKWNKRYISILPILLSMLLIITAWPLINGSIVNAVHWTSNNVKIPFIMDKKYENVLQYIREIPTDGKILSLPLTDPGYQIVPGEKGGAYVGPSMITYLTGRGEFAGYEEFGRYKDVLLSLIRKNEFEVLKKFLGLLNIRYIFYNADPLVYEKGFPTFPYNFVRNFVPDDQASYKQWLDKLDLTEKIAIDDKFYLYELDNKHFLPELFIADHSTYFSGNILDSTLPFVFIPESSRFPAIFESVNKPPRVDHFFLLAEAKSNLPKIQKNPELPLTLHNAFVTTKPNSILYPIVMLKEFVTLKAISVRKNIINSIDIRMFFSAKRVLEVEKWETDMTILGTIETIEDFKKLNKFSFWIFHPREVMSSWEWNFARYLRYMEYSIDALNRANMAEEDRLYQRFLINEYLQQHKVRLVKRFFVLGKKQKEVDYLTKNSYLIFSYLERKLQFANLDVDSMPYLIKIPEGEKTRYEIYKENTPLSDKGDSQVLKIQNKKLKQVGVQSIETWSSFGTIDVERGTRSLPLELEVSKDNNLMNNAVRIPLETTLESDYRTSLNLDTTFFKGQKGIFWTIPDWSSGNYYLLSFEYNTHKVPFQLKVFDRDKSIDGELQYKQALTDEFVSLKWAKYQAVVRARDFAEGAILGFVPYPFESPSVNLEIRNISIKHIPLPKIVLKKVPDQTIDRNKIIPDIKITKVNPTKYRVNIKNVKGPYTLVLNQAFNLDWNIFNPLIEEKTPLSITESFAGSIMQTVTQNSYYLWCRGFRADEKICKDREHKDITLPFLNDNRPFETWGKDRVAEDKHFTVNGYANAWYIEPEDVGGEKEHTLILEMGGQKLFYIFLTVSVVALVSYTLLLFKKR